MSARRIPEALIHAAGEISHNLSISRGSDGVSSSSLVSKTSSRRKENAYDVQKPECFFDAGDVVVAPADSIRDAGTEEVDINDRDAFTFSWNGRPCRGREVHRIILERADETLEEYLESHPKAVSQRFTYTTFFKTEEQEGSADPMHLAASRGHVEKVRILMQYGASVNTWVTRAGIDHYNVLSAAVFSEGHGASADMVHTLLEARAKMMPNLDGKHPLHLAFQVGSVPVIELLRRELSMHGPQTQAFDGQRPVSAPLACGITFGKMTRKQLVSVASLTPYSLKVFLQHDPGCITPFLKRVRAISSTLSGRKLASIMTVKEICEVMRRDRVAAGALLDAVTDRPLVENLGWHPLPTRMYMRGDNTITGKLNNMINLTHFLTLYEPECEWKYDALTFSAPKWHRKLNRQVKDFSLMVDVEVKVCHVPNVVCAEFFAALVDSTREEWDIYGNTLVGAAIDYAWWHGCYTVDLVMVFWSVCNLCVLVSDHWSSKALTEWSISAQFVVARSIVDVINEFIEFAGYCVIGRWRDYFALDNIIDVMRCAFPCILLFQYTTHTAVAVVLFCWLRLISAFNSAERIARVLLPVTRLVGGLSPAVAVTVLSFLACMHVFFLFQDSDRPFGEIWPEVSYKAVGLLITASLQETNGEVEIIFSYIALSMFTVVLLNIFIAIIGEQYIVEKEKSKETFLRTRAAEIQTYLLRARVIPCKLLRPWAARALWFLSFIGTGAVWALEHFEVASRTSAVNVALLCLCQMLMIFASFQRQNAPWANAGLCPSAADGHSGESFFQEHTHWASELTEGTLSQLLDGERAKKLDTDDAQRDLHYLWLVVPTEEEDCSFEENPVKKPTRHLFNTQQSHPEGGEAHPGKGDVYLGEATVRDLRRVIHEELAMRLGEGAGRSRPAARSGAAAPAPTREFSGDISSCNSTSGLAAAEVGPGGRPCGRPVAPPVPTQDAPPCDGPPSGASSNKEFVQV